MPQGELEQLLKDTQKRKEFSFVKNSQVIKKILVYRTDWEHDWSTVFLRILARIKKKHGIPDPVNKNGKYVSLPLGSDFCMSLFYILQPANKYSLYNFEISKRI